MLWPQLRRSHWLLPVTAACMMMGAMLAVQVRAREAQGEAPLTRGSGILARTGPLADLAAVLASTENKAKEQEKEISDLRHQVSEYTGALAKQQDVLKPVSEELQNLKVAMGLTEVKGPGIVLRLAEPGTRAVPSAGAESPDSMYLLHDFDLLQIANELWAAGAEAVALNDQRLVANTAIRCVGPAIQVNRVAVMTPYEFRAIGDPKVLIGALNMPDGTLDRLRAFKFLVSVTREDQIVLSAVGVSPKFEYARPTAKWVQQ